MDMGLSEQQELLRRSAREFLDAESPITQARVLEDSESGYSPELWKQMAALGWLGLGFPPQYGGSGGDPVDQAVLFEEIGRAILPSPILPSMVLSGQAILNAGNEEQKVRLLGGIGRGDVIVTLALDEPGAGLADGGLKAHAAPDGGDYVINGTKLFVPYAHVADYILCVASISDNTSAEGGKTHLEQVPDAPVTQRPTPAKGRVSLFLVDTSSPGITITLLESMAKYKQHEVEFRDVRVPTSDALGESGQGWGPLAKAIEWATVAQCGEMVGRAQKVLDMVVEYSKLRVQFGRPIGSFQAVQHRCADLMVAVDGARLITYQAAWKLGEGLPCSEDISIAKAHAGSASRQAAVAGHSIFAGIAFTVEHDMQLYTMRSKIAEANLGNTDFHLGRVGEYLAI